MLRFLIMSVLAVSMNSQMAGAALWQYRDHKGTVHFVKDKSEIPSQYRNQIKDITTTGALQTSAQGKPSTMPAGVSVAPAPVTAVPTNQAPVAPPQVVGAPSVQPQSFPNQDVANSDQATLDELKQKQLQAEAQSQMMASANPLSMDFKLLEGATFDSSKLPSHLKFLAKFMDHPKGKAFMGIFTKKETIDDLQKIMANPNKEKGGIALAVVFIISLIISMKITRSSMGFFARFFTKLILSVVTFIASLGVMVLVYGDPLVNLGKKIFDVFL